ncbi:MAG: diguanylate cyclase [Bryobacterales bacterium]|nr:diguanylate cyclase [Bryobacterales bacterium]
MELGAWELHIFVSLAVILGTAFIALIVDYLKGSNEQLREHNIELRVRKEETERRAILDPLRYAQPSILAAIKSAIASRSQTVEQREERVAPAAAEPERTVIREAETTLVPLPSQVLEPVMAVQETVEPPVADQKPVLATELLEQVIAATPGRTISAPPHTRLIYQEMDAPSAPAMEEVSNRRLAREGKPAQPVAETMVEAVPDAPLDVEAETAGQLFIAEPLTQTVTEEPLAIDAETAEHVFIAEPVAEATVEAVTDEPLATETEAAEQWFILAPIAEAAVETVPDAPSAIESETAGQLFIAEPLVEAVTEEPLAIEAEAAQHLFIAEPVAEAVVEAAPVAPLAVETETAGQLFIAEPLVETVSEEPLAIEAEAAEHLFIAEPVAEAVVEAVSDASLAVETETAEQLFIAEPLPIETEAAQHLFIAEPVAEAVVEAAPDAPSAIESETAGQLFIAEPLVEAVTEEPLAIEAAAAEHLFIAEPVAEAVVEAVSDASLAVETETAEQPFIAEPVAEAMVETVPDAPSAIETETAGQLLIAEPLAEAVSEEPLAIEVEAAEHLFVAELVAEAAVEAVSVAPLAIEADATEQLFILKPVAEAAVEIVPDAPLAVEAEAAGQLFITAPVVEESEVRAVAAVPDVIEAAAATEDLARTATPPVWTLDKPESQEAWWTSIEPEQEPSVASWQPEAELEEVLASSAPVLQELVEENAENPDRVVFVTPVEVDEEQHVQSWPLLYQFEIIGHQATENVGEPGETAAGAGLTLVPPPEPAAEVFPTAGSQNADSAWTSLLYDSDDGEATDPAAAHGMGLDQPDASEPWFDESDSWRSGLAAFSLAGDSEEDPEPRQESLTVEPAAIHSEVEPEPEPEPSVVVANDEPSFAGPIPTEPVLSAVEMATPVCDANLDNIVIYASEQEFRVLPEPIQVPVEPVSLRPDPFAIRPVSAMEPAAGLEVAASSSFESLPRPMHVLSIAWQRPEAHPQPILLAGPAMLPDARLTPESSEDWAEAAAEVAGPIPAGAVPIFGAPRVLEVPAGYHDGATLENLSRADGLFSGLVVSIGISDYRHLQESVGRTEMEGHMRSVISLVAGSTGDKGFACQTAEDEFVLVYPDENGRAAERRTNQVSERLWDFQLRSLGTFSILFSYGSVEVEHERLADTIQAANERMYQTKRNRRTVAMDTGRQKHAVGA